MPRRGTSGVDSIAGLSPAGGCGVTELHVRLSSPPLVLHPNASDTEPARNEVWHIGDAWVGKLLDRCARSFAASRKRVSHKGVLCHTRTMHSNVHIGVSCKGPRGVFLQKRDARVSFKSVTLTARRTRACTRALLSLGCFVCSLACQFQHTRSCTGVDLRLLESLGLHGRSGHPYALQ